MELKKSIHWNSFILSLVRIAIGWHFLYEGISKLVAENWTSYNYLMNTSGFLSGFYHWLAGSEGLLKIIDLLNIYGLLLIGLALFIGWFVRYAATAGVLLLTMYYFAYPPFGTSLTTFASTEGSLYIVNRIFIEAVVLLLIVFSKNLGYGIDNLITVLKKNKKSDSKKDEPSEPSLNSRREALKNLATIPVLGVVGFGALQNHKNQGIDVMSGATIQIKQAALGELKGKLPQGKIGGHSISRLVAGGNLIGGWAHARDLIYVSSLFKAYNTEKKVYETLMLAEQCGINTINIGFPSNPLLTKYKKLFGSKIKVISQVAPNMENGDIYEQMNQAIDYGADILQVQGNWCDWLVRDNKMDVIEKMLSRIREQGYTAGLASHTVDALIACEEQGIIPDYYMKTMHHDQYWSAHPMEKPCAF